MAHTLAQPPEDNEVAIARLESTGQLLKTLMACVTIVLVTGIFAFMAYLIRGTDTNFNLNTTVSVSLAFTLALSATGVWGARNSRRIRAVKKELQTERKRNVELRRELDHLKNAAPPLPIDISSEEAVETSRSTSRDQQVVVESSEAKPEGGVEG